MQQPFRQPAPDRLEVRGGGGCLSLSGTPFFVLGVYLILAFVGIVPVEEPAKVQPLAWLGIGGMGLIFLGMGGGLLFGRTWMVFDLGRACISRQWGLLVPLRREDLSLAHYQAVALRFDGGTWEDPRSKDSYRVLVKARGASKDLLLHSGMDYGAAHARATQLATFLSFPLEDATRTLATVVYPSPTAEASQEHSLNVSTLVARPPEMRSQVEEANGALRITFPRPGFSLAPLLRLAFPAGMMIFFALAAFVFFSETGIPWFVQSGIIGLIILLISVILLFNLARSAITVLRGGTCVTIAPGELRVEAGPAWRTRTTRIPTADVLDVTYHTVGPALSAAPHSSQARAARLLTLGNKGLKSRGITIRAKSGLTTFGAGLPDAEVYYLYSLLIHRLDR